MPLEAIGPTASAMCRRLGMSDSLSLLENAWSSELGGLQAWARIRALHHDTLVVEAASPAVIQELSLRRRELVRRLNGYFPKPVLSRLAIRIASDD